MNQLLGYLGDRKRVPDPLISAVVFDNLRLIHDRGLPEHKKLEVSDTQRHLHRIWLSRNKTST